ncbi:SPFH domain-containing protein [Aquihabitans daechungensis]|uniref:SPFH domain-containing protein n=1 Tax=Aquihabitans daechungensis TaxID=1052257 RepID=UPI003BA2387F
MSSIVIALAGLAVLFIAIVLFVVTRIKVAGPNEAFIITGRKGKGSGDTSGQKVVMGASVFVVPFVQKLGAVDLSSRQIGVSVPAAVSSNGIRCVLEGVAVVKVGGTEELIRAAAQRFLGQQQEIDVFTREVLAGSLRAIVGRLSVEEIIRDRAAFAAAVAEEAENSLTGQGLVLDTFQLQDIQAEGDYLFDLGRPEAARAAMEAAVAEANARREAEQARIRAEEEIAMANRQLSLKQAEIKAQTDAAAAEAAAAGPLAQAARDQDVISAQEQVAARRAELKERELDTEVRKPADAQRYAVEQEAASHKAQQIAKAEAHAEQIRLSGFAERENRTALAEAVKAEGLAEAASVLAKGQAEAEAMEKKAEAYKHYGDAAVLDIVASALPKVVAEAARPMSQIDKVTVISTDGASETVRNVTSTVAQGTELTKALLGVDLGALLQSFVASREGAVPTTAIEPEATAPGDEPAAAATTPGG